MKLEYIPTLEDAHQAWHEMPRPRALHWGIRLIVCGPLLVLAAALILTLVDSAGWLCATVLPAGWLLLLWRVYRPIKASDWKKDPANAERVILRFDSNHVAFERADSSTQFAWSAFTGFKETQAMFFAWQDGSRDCQLAVPKRVFPSGREMEEFRSILSTSLDATAANRDAASAAASNRS